MSRLNGKVAGNARRIRGRLGAGSLLEALLGALVDRYLAGWDTRLGETAQDLPSVIDAVLDSQTQGSDCQLLWELWAMSSRDPAANAALTRFYAGYLDRVAYLTTAARPDLALEAARDCAVLIVALIEGLSIRRGAGRDAALAPRARTQIHAAVEALVLSLDKPASRSRV